MAGGRQQLKVLWQHSSENLKQKKVSILTWYIFFFVSSLVFHPSTCFCCGPLLCLKLMCHGLPKGHVRTTFHISNHWHLHWLHGVSNSQVGGATADYRQHACFLDLQQFWALESCEKLCFAQVLSNLISLRHGCCAESSDFKENT